MGVIMLAGPIGAGKTTVARELAALWPGPLVHIEGDRFWPFLAKPKPGRHEAFRLLMRSVTGAAQPFARSGYDVLLDFSFPPAFLKTARAILKETPLDYVLLRPSLEVCAERARTRVEGRIADYRADFYARFEGHDDHAAILLDAPPRAIAEAILTDLAEGRFRVGAFV